MDGVAAAAAAPPPAPVRPVLYFDDPWQAKTRPTSFEGVVRPGEVVSLNHIRDMTGQRNIACVREQARSSISPDQVQWFKKYLSNLAYLIDQEKEREDLEFEWTSPLSGRPNRFFRLTGLPKEQAMATFLYGALLRQLAAQALDDLLGVSPGIDKPLEGEARAAATAEAATLLRQAAGVFSFLSEQLAPPVVGTLRGERPCELHPPTGEAMSLLCCAEAQALTAFRSEERSSSPPLVAALHAGCAGLYEKAAKVLRNAHGDLLVFGEHFKRYCAIGSGLASARAQKAMAKHHHGELQAGLAEGCCQEASRLLKQCLAAAEGDGGWRGLLQEEAKQLEALRLVIEKDRLYVYCQPLPREAPPLPEPKVLVSPVTYTIERVTNTQADLAMNR